MSFPAEGDHQHHHRIPVAQEGELYSLKWHTFQSHLTSGLKQFLFDGDFLTDVTLVAEGKMIRSHRMLLSLCSPHFKQLFQGNSAQNVNTIVILNNVRYQDLQHVIQFIYNGEVKVSNNYELQGFLQTGELLQIEGLTKTSSKHETEGREPASQQQQGHLSPNAQSTPIPQMHHRRSHIQVPNKGGPGPARSHQIPVTSAGDGSSHPPPTKRTRLLPTATVTSATVAYGEANNVVSSITGDLNSSSLEDGGDGVSGIDPLAVPDLSSIAAMVEHDPLNLMNETGVSQHQHQHGVPGIDDEEQMITIDSIKSESGVEGLYDERDEEEDEEGFEMTDHGDASGLGVDGMYDVKSSGPGPSSAISGGASVGGGANVKPPGKRIQDNRDDDDGDPPINNRNSLPKLSIHEQICVPCTRVTSSGVVCHGLMHKRYRRTNCKRKDNLKSNSSTKQIDGVLPGFELLLRCNKCSTWRSLKKWQEINYIY